jgi:hypothetical protein
MLLRLKAGGLAEFLVFFSSLLVASSSCHRSSDDGDAVAPSANEGLDHTPAELAPNPGYQRMRGDAELSNLILEKWGTSDSLFRLSYYLGGSAGDGFTVRGLAPLLGYFDADLVNGGWKNVTPSAATIAGHVMAYDKFAEQVFTEMQGLDFFTATNNKYFIIKPTAKSLLERYLAQGLNLSSVDKSELWKLTTLETEPSSKYESWLAMLPEYEKFSGKEKVRNLIIDSLLSPDVLFLK